MPPIVVAALYRFTTLENYKDLRQPLLDAMQDNNVKGTLLLAHEGINGTISGSQQGIDRLISWIRDIPQLALVECKFSYDNSVPFYRSRVKLKKEIVTLGVDGIDPVNAGGTYVKPKDWNDLIANPEVTVIDTRNDYESAIGSFEYAKIPNTHSFREFPDYVANNLDPARHKKVAMFCTGGIRCEKSTAYLKQQGFEEVYHLQGGILKYLEEVPVAESLWRGECFVFDNRVSVDHALQKGSYDQCHACRLPITQVDKQSEHYQPGISCPACFHSKTDAERQRFAEREKQIQLAKLRGESHIGSESGSQMRRRKELKKATKDRQRKTST